MQNDILIGLGRFVSVAVQIYLWLVIIRVLLSWINPNPYSPVMRFLGRATDPALNMARRHFPLTLGGLDFSPIILLILLSLVGYVLGGGLQLIGAGASAAALLPLLVLGLLQMISSLAWLAIILMIARVVISLVSAAPYNPIVMVVYGLTEPLLAPLRRWLPPGPRGLDLRALVFIAGLLLLDRVVVRLLVGVAGDWLTALAGSPLVR